MGVKGVSVNKMLASAKGPDIPIYNLLSFAFFNKTKKNVLGTCLSVSRNCSVILFYEVK